MPRKFTPLTTDRLTLRRFQEADMPAFLAYRNDPEVARFQSWEAIKEAGARTFIQAMIAAPYALPGEGFQIAVALHSGDRLIGDLYLLIDPEEPRQAEFGYTFAREQWGHGYAREALTQLITHCFTDLTLHRLFARTDTRNERSVALLHRLGLRREGHFIDHYWFKGEWTSEYLYALLAREWPPAS